MARTLKKGPFDVLIHEVKHVQTEKRLNRQTNMVTNKYLVKIMNEINIHRIVSRLTEVKTKTTKTFNLLTFSFL